MPQSYIHHNPHYNRRKYNSHPLKTFFDPQHPSSINRPQKKFLNPLTLRLLTCSALATVAEEINNEI
jgi:hypothetical protein